MRHEVCCAHSPAMDYKHQILEKTAKPPREKQPEAGMELLWSGWFVFPFSSSSQAFRHHLSLMAQGQKYFASVKYEVLKTKMDLKLLRVLRALIKTEQDLEELLCLFPDTY